MVHTNKCDTAHFFLLLGLELGTHVLLTVYATRVVVQSRRKSQEYHVLPYSRDVQIPSLRPSIRPGVDVVFAGVVSLRGLLHENAPPLFIEIHLGASVPTLGHQMLLSA